MAVRTNCQGFSALVTHDSLPFIVSRQQLHAANLVHLQLFMPFAAQLANPGPEAGCHVEFVKSHSAAKNFSLEDDEIIIVATGILRVIDTEFAVDRILIDDLALRTAVFCCQGFVQTVFHENTEHME